MLNTLFGIYLADKFNLKTDRIIWSETVDASSTSNLTLTNAFNGAALKGDLASFDYFATKYTMWSQNGIIGVDIKPDGEAQQALKTNALTQKTEAPLIPPKYIETEVELELTNEQEISDDVTVVLDIFKIEQSKVAELLDIANTFTLSPEHIDLQTLGIQKNQIVTNKILLAILSALGGSIPSEDLVLPTPESTYIRAPVCKRV